MVVPVAADQIPAVAGVELLRKAVPFAAEIVAAAAFAAVAMSFVARGATGPGWSSDGFVRRPSSAGS